jgi:hypothetical protein
MVVTNEPLALAIWDSVWIDNKINYERHTSGARGSVVG